MKNSKSPIKFLGALSGMAGAAAGTAGIGSLFGGGNPGSFQGRNQGIIGGTAGQNTGVGTGIVGQGVDLFGQGASGQFGLGAVQAANGVYGNMAGSQFNYGQQGMFRKSSKYDNK